MQEITDENYRKIVRNFKGRMEFMNKTPTIDAVKTEKKRFPDKSIKEIILEMHKFHEKLKAMGRKNKWK